MKKLTLILLGAILFISCSREENATISQIDMDKMKRINIYQDMIEYLESDKEQGYIPKHLADSYIYIAEELLKDDLK